MENNGIEKDLRTPVIFVVLYQMLPLLCIALYIYCMGRFHYSVGGISNILCTIVYFKFYGFVN